MTTTQPHKVAASAAPGSFMSYSIGFMLSIILTVAAYLLVVEKLLTGTALVGALIALALAQLVVQLLFFLHLGNETKPRWNLLIFLFMTLVVGIIAGGSLWIMHNLDYNMLHDMTPTETRQYMSDHEGL